MHGYYQVDPDIVWSVIKDDLKPLHDQVVHYLEEVNWNDQKKSKVVVKETAVHKSLLQTAARMNNAVTIPMKSAGLLG